MAPRKEHEPGYNSWEAKTVRALDTSGAGLKSVWDHMSFKRGSVAGVATAALLGMGSLGVTTIGHITQDGPTGGTQRIIDHDISGNGYMARGYSYLEYEDVQYLLIEDEGQFELYQFNQAKGQMRLVNFETADAIISEFVVDDRAYIDSWNELTGSNYTADRATCDLIYEPETRNDGAVSRVVSGCHWVSGKSASEITEIFEDNLSFWLHVDQNLTEATYGPDPERVTPYQPLDRSHIESYGERLTDTAQMAFGGWLALGMLGAGVSGIRRRAEKKNEGTIVIF